MGVVFYPRIMMTAARFFLSNDTDRKKRTASDNLLANYNNYIRVSEHSCAPISVAIRAIQQNTTGVALVSPQSAMSPRPSPNVLACTLITCPRVRAEITARLAS